MIGIKIAYCQIYVQRHNDWLGKLHGLVYVSMFILLFIFVVMFFYYFYAL